MRTTIILFLLFLIAQVFCAEEKNVFVFEEKEQTTTVEALNANYDGDKIILSGNVIISNLMGEARAETAVLEKEEPKTQKIDFPYLELKKGVCVKLTDGGNLYCEEVSIDLIAMRSLFQGKYNEMQVVYEDKQGQISADKAAIDFVKDEQGKYAPQKVTLVGHIQIVEQKNDGNRYALADYVEVFPQINKMVLKAEKSNKVLFFDEKKNIQLSAQSITATKDKLTGKESIHGSGDVKFIFAKDEIEKLNGSLKFFRAQSP